MAVCAQRSGFRNRMRFLVRRLGLPWLEDVPYAHKVLFLSCDRLS